MGNPLPNHLNGPKTNKKRNIECFEMHFARAPSLGHPYVATTYPHALTGAFYYSLLFWALGVKQKQL